MSQVEFVLQTDSTCEGLELPCIGLDSKLYLIGSGALSSSHIFKAKFIAPSPHKETRIRLVQLSLEQWHSTCLVGGIEGILPLL